jgi:predicted Zn-dependent protease
MPPAGSGQRRKASELSIEALAERRSESRAAVIHGLEPGEYAVVCDPYVTGDLLNMLNLHGMGAQAVLDGRSWMNGRQGSRP